VSLRTLFLCMALWQLVPGAAGSAGALGMGQAGRMWQLPLENEVPGSVWIYLPQEKDLTGVWVLVPGYGGDGREFLRGEAGRSWIELAHRERIALVCPSFAKIPLAEIHQRRGYYYPDQGSGEAVWRAVEEVRRETGMTHERVGWFGFSAGAHFVHRFALWKPERVTCLVACAAGWWDEPTEGIRAVPALILCGEEDSRLNASLAFFQKGRLLGAPWVWRSFPGTGHEVTPEVRQLAQLFMSHYWQDDRPDEARYGDAQSFQLVSRETAMELPEICRVILPNAEFARKWAENTTLLP